MLIARSIVSTSSQLSSERVQIRSVQSSILKLENSRMERAHVNAAHKEECEDSLDGGHFAREIEWKVGDGEEICSTIQFNRAQGSFDCRFRTWVR